MAWAGAGVVGVEVGRGSMLGWDVLISMGEIELFFPRTGLCLAPWFALHANEKKSNIIMHTGTCLSVFSRQPTRKK